MSSLDLFICLQRCTTKYWLIRRQLGEFIRASPGGRVDRSVVGCAGLSGRRRLGGLIGASSAGRVYRSVGGLIEPSSAGRVEGRRRMGELIGPSSAERVNRAVGGWAG